MSARIFLDSSMRGEPETYYDTHVSRQGWKGTFAGAYLIAHWVLRKTRVYPRL